MALGWKIVIDAPKSLRTAKTFEFTPAHQSVLSIDVDNQSESKRISTMQVRIFDPEWRIFGELPDPTYLKIPIRMFMSRFEDANSPVARVFQGCIVSLQAGYPGPTTLTIDATDESCDLRKIARVRTFRNQTSVQIAQSIVQEYDGLKVDTSQLGDVTLKRRTVDIGMSGVGNAWLSDWDHIAKALAADGLSCHMDASTLYIQQNPEIGYPRTFKRSQPPVLKLDVNIKHVGVSSSWDTKAQGDKTQTDRSVDGETANEADAIKATKAGHRSGPPQGPDVDTVGAHSEQKTPGPGKNRVTKKRSLKDTATLVCTPINDITVRNTVELSGWGAKVDGHWRVRTIRHHIAGDLPTTTLTLSAATHSIPVSGASFGPLQTQNVPRAPATP